MLNITDLKEMFITRQGMILLYLYYYNYNSITEFSIKQGFSYASAFSNIKYLESKKLLILTKSGRDVKISLTKLGISVSKKLNDI